MTRTIPEGYQTVTPMVIVKDARKAIDFYQRAFGAVERCVMPNPGGKGVMHAELQIGSSIIMLSEENPGQACRSAETVGGSPISFYLYLDDVEHGAGMPVQEMFWGDRIGAVLDPFGYSWTLATHVRDLTQEEINQGAEAFIVLMKNRSPGENSSGPDRSARKSPLPRSLA
jgi:PhnB protein